jgi:enoyl-CoA hydratase
MSYETILVEQIGRVGKITLHRPAALNALNAQMMRDVVAAAEMFQDSGDVGCLLLTGSEKAFAAGADIKEMAAQNPVELTLRDPFRPWDRFVAIRIPSIAAVAGFALGGGCELAMMTDIILAADTAKFGQPEIKLGVMPGLGGSQRLIRAIGKAKATEMCLTGRMMDAAEAERAGLVARVIPAADLQAEALKMATMIANMPLTAVLQIKAALVRAFEISLREGLMSEREAFNSLFGTADQKEGMAAFVEKRPAVFTHR